MPSTTSSGASCSISSQPAEVFGLDLIAAPLVIVEKRLREQVVFFDSRVKQYIEYACDGQGKRLRPVLALLAGGATGELLGEHTDLAVILELVHIASLVHDDIMDGAELRRDRKTLNAKWGNSVTVLVGDMLFAHALKMATHFSERELCRRIADAALGVCTGEILQTEHRFDLSLTLDDYYRMVEMKTASLFSTACELGAMLNNASPLIVQALKNYGSKVGIAYQILDDCIDLMGDEKNIGKTLGTDLVGGKFTLPVLLLLQASSKEEQKVLHQLLLDKKKIDRKDFMTIIQEKGVLKAAIAEAEDLLDQAEDELEVLAKNPYVDCLRGITSYLRGMLARTG